MAFKRWLGRAGAVAQVDTVTIAGTWAAGDTVTLVINDKSLVVTIGSLVTTAEVATSIRQAWENAAFTDTTATKVPGDGGQDFAEHAEITATESGSVLTLTHDTAGTPFTLTVTEVTAGTGTATEATARAATGPNHWDNVNNWEPGVDLPGASVSDQVVIENSSVSILHGLDQNAITNNLASLDIAQNYTGDIGLPRQNAGGYVEYRDTYLKIPVDAVTIGRGAGSGSGRIKLDTHDATPTVLVENTGSSTEFGVAALLLKGAANTTLTLIEGNVAVAPFGDDSASVDVITNTAGSIYVGAGNGTVTTLDNESGNIVLYGAATTVTNASGTLFIGGAAAVATLNLKGGSCFYESTAGITTLTIGGSVSATFDASRGNTARTIATLNVKPNMTIIDPLRTLTYTSIVFNSDVRTWQAA